jgi:signal peptidase I
MNWILFIAIIQVVHFLGTWKLYKAAGRKAWEAAVPVYNAVVLMQIINRPVWWVILLFIPVVNLIMFPVVWVEIARSFRHNSKSDTFWAIISLGFYSFYLNYFVKNLRYKENRSREPLTEAGEWTSSILFAVVAATIVHNYFFQPFVIPTSSLEKSLLVGDYLFVSKIHYGPRTPMTPVAAPMVHDTIPLVGLKSYTDAVELPYFRFPGFSHVKRNDIVVFNWPADTVQFFFQKPTERIRKPVDKKSNYVKRAVGMPGDLMEIKDGYVFINGEQNQLPERAKLQFFYRVKVSQGFNVNTLVQRYDVREAYQLEADVFLINLDEENYQKLKRNSNVISIERKITPAGENNRVFPNGAFAWNEDNMGPIQIPQAGMTVDLNMTNLPLYFKIISEYEGHELSTAQGQIYIDGSPVDSYTFAMDYYWMMGDNRHASEDSRFWGFVPENHIVGKPVFIWFSKDDRLPGMRGIRWDRVFTTVSGDGPRVSYFPYFVILLFGYLGYSFYRRRKGPRK